MKTTIQIKSMLAGLSVGAMALMLALSQAQANEISGDIGFSGTYSLPAGQNLGDATELVNISAVVVSKSGSYAPITMFTSAAFANPLHIKPATPAPLLWTVISGGNTYTFGATTSSVSEQGAGPSGGYVLDMGGTGWAEIDGIDKTYGTWLVTASQSGMALGFESTGSVVPDGGMTLGLLGSVFTGLTGLRLASRRQVSLVKA
jgi:hypothetical protein